nr:hypothetical protein [Tanacetum cinerariifolium]
MWDVYVKNHLELEGSISSLLLWHQSTPKSGNHLKKVECPGDCDSEDEVASVDNDMARSMASEMVGFDTENLLEQWRDSYGNGDYDEDPYEDDMYEGLQAVTGGD